MSRAPETPIKWRDSGPMDLLASIPPEQQVVLESTAAADYIGVLLLPPIEVLKPVAEERDDIITLEDIERQRLEREARETKAHEDYLWDRLNYQVGRLDTVPTADYSDPETRQEVRIYPELNELIEEVPTGEVEVFVPPPVTDTDGAIEIHEATPLPVVAQDGLRDQVLERAQQVARAVDDLVSRLSNDDVHLELNHPNYQWEDQGLDVIAENALCYKDEDDYELLQTAEDIVAHLGAKPRQPETPEQSQKLLTTDQAIITMQMAEPNRRLLNFARTHLPGLIEEDMDLRQTATECFLKEMVPLNRVHQELMARFKDDHYKDGQPHYPKDIKQLWPLYVAVRDLHTDTLGIAAYDRKVKKHGQQSRMHPAIRQEVVNRLSKHIKEMDQLALDQGGDYGDN